MDGAALRALEQPLNDLRPAPRDSVKSLAVDFLLYGTLAEVFGREAGFNKGMGGSMHAFFTPFGVYPNNLGHITSNGCFRCHDDGHTAADGTTISGECEYCHVQK